MDSHKAQARNMYRRLLLACCMLSYPNCLIADPKVINEKANIIYSIAKFISDWPITFCVTEEETQLYLALKKVIQRKKIKNSTLRIKMLPRKINLTSCDILFVSKLGESKKYASQMENGSNILTITSGVPSHNRGVFHLKRTPGGYKVIVDLWEAKKRGIKVSAELLDLATKK